MDQTVSAMLQALGTGILSLAAALAGARLAGRMQREDQSRRLQADRERWVRDQREALYVDLLRLLARTKSLAWRLKTEITDIERDGRKATFRKAPNEDTIRPRSYDGFKECIDELEHMLTLVLVRSGSAVCEALNDLYEIASDVFQYEEFGEIFSDFENVSEMSSWWEDRIGWIHIELPGLIAEELGYLRSGEGP